jgi:hypothetical protein
VQGEKRQKRLAKSARTPHPFQIPLVTINIGGEKEENKADTETNPKMKNANL